MENVPPEHQRIWLKVISTQSQVIPGREIVLTPHDRAALLCCHVPASVHFAVSETQLADLSAADICDWYVSEHPIAGCCNLFICFHTNARNPL